MLIRVRGGREGIKDYLERGQKDGREFGRDQLDERVILSGDLALTHAVINDMGNSGERYLHITLSFREDKIDRDKLKSITEEFRDFALSAYQPDEYNFYAEAHLPRIKSYTNKQTGQEVERKPHIHVVLPKQNLMSGTLIDPLYRPAFDKAGQIIVPEAQMQWLEAFQEHINAKYGLASPKDHPRLEYTDESTIIARFKGDLFRGDRSELKDKILAAVLDRGVTNFDDFRSLVSEYGDARLRRTGLAGEYMNVKPPGAAKGTNLKEHVFSKTFIELPTLAKQQRLVADARAQYLEAGQARPAQAEIEQRLQHWHSVRSRELKYLNPGSRRAYADYKAADPAQRRVILAEREAAYYERHAKELTHDSRRDREPNASVIAREPETFGRHRMRRLSELRVVRIEGRSPVLLQGDAPRDVEHQGTERDHRLRRVLPAVGRDDSVLGQLTRDVAERDARQAAERDGFARIKAELDAHRLLAHLSRSHGLAIDKYQVSQAQDGSHRIAAGSRRLNVSDFLTKELHLTWEQAAPLLREVHADQLAKQAAHIGRQAPDRHLWLEFKRWQPERREAEWQAQRDSEVTRRGDLRAQHQAELRKVRNDRQLGRTERQAALRSLSALRAARSRALSDTFALERQTFKERHTPLERYRTYLLERAQNGDVGALTELRRQRARALPPAERSLHAAPGHEHAARPASLLHRLSYRVDREGVVTYFDHQKNPVMRDTGQHVCIDQQGRAATEAGLRLAIEKFGGELAVTGSEAFRRSVVEIAVQHKLEVRFADPAMNDYAKHLVAAREHAGPAAAGPGLAKDATPGAGAARTARELEQPAPKPPAQKNRDLER